MNAPYAKCSACHQWPCACPPAKVYVSALRAAAAPIGARILAAHHCSPGARRIVAIMLLREMLLAGTHGGSVATSTVAQQWSDLSWLLLRCARELAGEGTEHADRVEDLRRESRAAMAVCTALRCQIRRKLPRGRVIDAVSTVVAVQQPRAALAQVEA